MIKTPIATEESTDPTEYKTLAELDAEESAEVSKDDDDDGEGELDSDLKEEEEKKPAKGKTKAVKVEEKPEEEGGDNEEPEGGDEPEEGDPELDDSFFEEVDALHGEELEVDYEGVDPMSPEGVFKREQAVADRAVNQFEQILKEKAPRQYAFLVHGLTGGTEEEFFEKTKDILDLPTEEQLEVDEGLQRQVIEYNLKAKGNSERHIKAILKAAAEDDELEEMAKEALEEESENRARRLAEIEKEVTAQNEKKTADIQEMTEFVHSIVTSGKLGNIQIPEKDRKAFATEFNASLRYDNGRFLSVTELTQDNIEETFQKEYFKFKKGNLDGLIERRARTENTKRLKRTINTNPKPKSTQSPSSTGLALGEL